MSKAAPTVTQVHDQFHEGYLETLRWLSRDFFWKSLKSQVRDFFCSCLVCQRHKVEHLHLAGLLQPLGFPFQVWLNFVKIFLWTL